MTKEELEEILTTKNPEIKELLRTGAIILLINKKTGEVIREIVNEEVK